jgi:hypothetical protein
VAQGLLLAHSKHNVCRATLGHSNRNEAMNRIIYIIGAVVVVLAIFSFLGMR